jgi:plasmid rolling circle replication initiator protein Rep
MGEAKRRREYRQQVPKWGKDKRGNVRLAPADHLELQSELFDTAHTTDRIRPWHERRQQAYAVAMGYRQVAERTGDCDIAKLADRCSCCGLQLTFREMYCAEVDKTRMDLIGANFCHARLCPMCQWRRAQKVRYQLGRVVAEILEEDPDRRLIMVTLTEPNSSPADFGEAIGRLQAAATRFVNYRKVKRAFPYWIRVLEITCPRPGELHPHFHLIAVVPPEYFEANSKTYLTQEEVARLWAQALGTKDHRIVDVRKTENHHEVCKYVTKPQDYLSELPNGEWWCNSENLEAFHYGLAHRRMSAWSRSCSPIRRRLGFLKNEEEKQAAAEAAEDLVDVGHEDDGLRWIPMRELVYRWRRSEEGRWHYSLWRIDPIKSPEADPSDADDFASRQIDWVDTYGPDTNGGDHGRGEAASIGS